MTEREKLINEIADKCVIRDADILDFELDLTFLETQTLKILSEGLDKK